MHRFLTTFLCLSTLAMAQNVLAGTPRPPFQVDPQQTTVQSAGERVMASGLALSQAAIGGEVPSTGTVMLFVTGLAGLSAVGRSRPSSRVPASPVIARS